MIRSGESGLPGMRNASNTGPTKARKHEKGENAQRSSARKRERGENAKRTENTRPSAESRSISARRFSRSSLRRVPACGIFRAERLSRLRLFRAFASALLLALLAIAAGGRLRHWRAESAAASAWDRPESAEEGRLLRTAQERPAEGSAQAILGRYYLAVGHPFEALCALQRARAAAVDGRALALTSRPARHKPTGGPQAPEPAKAGFVSTDRGFTPGLASNPALGFNPGAEADGLALLMADALESA